MNSFEEINGNEMQKNRARKYLLKEASQKNFETLDKDQTFWYLKWKQKHAHTYWIRICDLFAMCVTSCQQIYYFEISCH